MSYKIGELAAQLGTTVRTIRYYEEAGLLTPLRSAGGTRLYNALHLARLQAILALAGQGFSLEAIRDLVQTREQCRTGDEGSQRVPARLDEVIAHIDHQLEDLQNLKQALSAARARVKQCRGCRNPPTSEGCPECPVRQHRHESEMLNLLWDQE
ncbi:MAG: MerR family transcriptional regulator [Pseudomonadota bacterium]|nr:MerR family transcriptional regulator [Pseudomonadota bacterium]